MKNMSDRMLEIAKEAHKKQKRHNGEPYIQHPIRVGNAFKDEFRRTLGFGHDIIEDWPEYEEQIKKEFPKEIYQGLKLLTREKDETYFKFIMKILRSRNISVIQVKLEDLRDNTNDHKEGSKKDKYRFATYILSKGLSKTLKLIY